MDDVERSYEKIIKNIIQVSNEPFGFWNVNVHHKQTKKPWFTEEVKTGKKQGSLYKITKQENAETTRNRTNQRVKAIKKNTSKLSQRYTIWFLC